MSQGVIDARSAARALNLGAQRGCCAMTTADRIHKKR